MTPRPVCDGGTIVTMTVTRIPVILKHGHQVPPSTHERPLPEVTCKKKTFLYQKKDVSIPLPPPNNILLPVKHR